MIPSEGSKTAFFEELLKANRKLELEYEWATGRQTEAQAKVRSAAADFLQAYVDFNQIPPDKALAAYLEFNRRYILDIQAFIATGKYPLEADPQLREMARTDYDLALLISILVMPHRAAIMEEIAKASVAGKLLVIGVGSGVELGFIHSSQGGEAYDLYINPFARKAFPQWNFHEEWYRPSSSGYGTVFAIEILEHLADPYAFAADCRDSLAPGGRFITTTASNVPQFDHCYNFVSDEDFEGRLAALGFEMETKRVIPHEYGLMNIRAKNPCPARNVFYVFRKN